MNIYKYRNFLTIHAKNLFNGYWVVSKEKLLTAISVSLAGDKDKNFKEYHNWLNRSLSYFNYGIIILIIVSALIVISLLWNVDILLFDALKEYLNCLYY